MAALLTLAFLGLTLWWVFMNTRPPSGDSSRHLGYAFGFRQALSQGDLTAPFEGFNTYPPLVHLVGAITTLITGPSVTAPVVVSNLLFVPLFAAGCYGAGAVVFDRRTGALAALFALGTPMVLSLFRSFLLDGPLMALVAVTVWLLLASDRFAHRRYAVAAGVFSGLGLMAKPTFPIFVAGLVAVMLLRGGWRRPLNVALYALPAAVLVAPWYFTQAGAIRSHAVGINTIVSERPIWYANVPYPERWSLENFTWYAWSLLNNQLFLPLTVFAAIGIGWAVVALVRRCSPSDLLPELLGGLAASYVGISLLIVDDPRYSIPMLVYVAVLGVAWIPRLTGRRRPAAIAVLAAIALLNALQTDVGLGRSVALDFGGDPRNPIGESRVNVTTVGGYVDGPPDTEVRILEILRAARRDGVRRVVIHDLTGEFWGPEHLTPLLHVAGLGFGASPAHLGPQDMWIQRGAFAPHDPQPVHPVGLRRHRRVPQARRRAARGDRPAGALLPAGMSLATLSLQRDLCRSVALTFL